MAITIISTGGKDWTVYQPFSALINDKVQLPCDINPPTPDDQMLLMLWYKDDQVWYSFFSFKSSPIAIKTFSEHTIKTIQFGYKENKIYISDELCRKIVHCPTRSFKQGNRYNRTSYSTIVFNDEI
ncbi:hypothetical protein BLOT_010912 [Blomia tropicalis]|nr:hypothetical protein BLOT_010912 [Blomia tropicalis]